MENFFSEMAEAISTAATHSQTNFLGAIWWEFVQNLFPTLFFVAAVWLWAQDFKKQALLSVVIGGVVGSLIIHVTEPIVSGEAEPFTVTAANIVTFSLFMFLFMAYLASETGWSNWKMDWLLGGLAGLFIGLAQGLVDPGSWFLGIVAHCIALGLAFPLILNSIRSLKAKSFSAVFTGAFVITVITTLAIGLVDYSYLIFF